MPPSAPKGMEWFPRLMSTISQYVLAGATHKEKGQLNGPDDILGTHSLWMFVPPPTSLTAVDLTVEER
jgi:hypothetical protein